MSQSPARTARPSRGEGRDALIEAALQILAERGLKAVTYRSVAERAGVVHGLVRHHFHSLDALVHAAVHRAAARSITLTLLEPESADLDQFAAGLAENVRVDRNQHAVMYEVAMEALRRPELGEEMKAVYRRYLDAVSRELDRLGLREEDDALARVVFAALDGLVLQQLIFGRPGDLETGIDRLRSLLATERAARLSR